MFKEFLDFFFVPYLVPLIIIKLFLFIRKNMADKSAILSGGISSVRVCFCCFFSSEYVFCCCIENLGVRSEGAGDKLTAAICYRSAAKCAGSLAHHKHAAGLLIRAARLFFDGDSVRLHAALRCYHNATDRYVFKILNRGQKSKK